jgi:peptidoglycan hydrolase-like protein with peptidoglycan-binding domain
MVGVGLTAAPAMAESGTGGVATHDTAVASTVPAPDGVSPAAWSAALGEAQSKFGAGDKAALEAMKQVDLMAVTYCMVYDNITVGGAWYKIPASTSSAGFSCVLESGVNSQGVSALQQTLNKCYGRSLVVDGAFGPATYNALMYAQGVAGIAVDGVYGSGSRKNLKWWGGGSVCTKGTTLGL